MKKQKGLFIICLCLCLAIISSQTMVLRAEAVPVFEVEIPDPVLKSQIIHTLRLQDEGKITNIDLLQLRGVQGYGIHDLTGLEYAINLEEISCSFGQITSLKSLGNCSKLQYVNCDNNKITSLEGLENKFELRELRLNNNQITSITELENNSALKSVELCSNQIVSLKGLENKPNLDFVGLSYNQITDLTPLQNNLNIQSIDFNFNEVSSLSPLKNMEHLITVCFTDNQIGDLTALQNSTELQRLEADRNQITSLEGLENKEKLKYISLAQNQITDLTLLKNSSNLWYVNLKGNQIKTLKGLEDKPKILHLYVDDNQLIDITALENNLGLLSVTMKNNQLISLKGLEDKQKLEHLVIDNNQIDSLIPLEGCSGLRAILMANNQVSDLSPLKSCSKLEGIIVNDNHISSIKELDGLNLIALYALNQTIEQEVVVEPNKPLVVHNIIQGSSSTKPLEETSWVEPDLGENPYNGIYDRETNTITWENIPSDVNEVTYSFKQFDGSDTPWETVVSGKELYFEGKVTIKLIHNPNTAPVIEVSDKVLTVGDNFDPLEGVVAMDKEDGEIVVTGSSIVYNDVDTTKAGTYQVIYKVVDQGGMSATKSISVQVNPKQIELNAAPVIEVSDKVLTVGDNFDPLEGVVATDKEDGNILITGSNIIYNNVDMAKVGTYYVLYKVTDKNGTSTVKNRIVYVQEKTPIIVDNNNSVIPVLPEESGKKDEETSLKQEDQEDISNKKPVQAEDKDSEFSLKGETTGKAEGNKEVVLSLKGQMTGRTEEDKDIVLSLKGQTIGKIEEDKLYHLKGQNSDKLKEEKEKKSLIAGLGKNQENSKGTNVQGVYHVVKQQGMFVPKTDDNMKPAIWWTVSSVSICFVLLGIRRKLER